MGIDRLDLSDFRNHGTARLSPEQSMIVLTGENGAGKTNILEAVSLLAPGRGLRGAPLRDMARQDGPGGFAIAAEVAGGTIGTGTAPDAPDRRLVRIDGRQSAANSLGEYLAISWLTPAMDRLFLESPGGRRRFLDRLVLALSPAHAAHSARYEAAMRARNTLLTGERPADPDWLSALEAQMAEHGEAIHSARTDLVAALTQALAGEDDEPFARPLLALEGFSGSGDDLAEALRLGRGRDTAAGRALTGPHRVDLVVTHAAKGQPAGLCSTGEQKALLLSLVLAHGALVRDRTRRPLVLLLDELAAHLDARRRVALFERLRAIGGQVWMTGTEPGLFEGLGEASRFRVADGQVELA